MPTFEILRFSIRNSAVRLGEQGGDQGSRLNIQQTDCIGSSFEILRAWLGDCEATGRTGGATCISGASSDARCFLTIWTASIF